jgi:class 3 adenylate cyclase
MSTSIRAGWRWRRSTSVRSSCLGAIASYALERSNRLLFLRERELDRERARSESLLRNILPLAIIDRLKARHEDAEDVLIADALDQVTVVFVDSEGSRSRRRTRLPMSSCRRSTISSRGRRARRRFGLEKIKTVGDAYMAVAGAPEPIQDDAEAAAEMPLAAHEALTQARWPSGRPIRRVSGSPRGPWSPA